MDFFMTEIERTVKHTFTEQTTIPIGRGHIDYPPGTFRIKREAYEWLVAKGLANPGETVEEEPAEEPVEEVVAEDESEQTTEPDQVPETHDDE